MGSISTEYDHMRSVEKYKNTFSKRGIELSIIHKGNSRDKERLLELIIKMDSPEFLFPKDPEVSLNMYVQKLTDHAYNFILSDGNDDIGILSFYANNFDNKTAYVSSIGILPSYRGGRIIFTLIRFGIGFLEELGMKYVKAEINKRNEKWLNFLTRYYFKLESETNHNSHIIVRNLNENRLTKVDNSQLK